jgi:hypothetical protein
MLLNCFQKKPILQNKYKVMQGEKAFWTGPAFSYKHNSMTPTNLKNPSLIPMTLKERMNLALNQYMATPEFTAEKLRQFPPGGGVIESTFSKIEWSTNLPLLAFVVTYWIFAGLDKYYAGELNTMPCCMRCPSCRRAVDSKDTTAASDGKEDGDDGDDDEDAYVDDKKMGRATLTMIELTTDVISDTNDEMIESDVDEKTLDGKNAAKSFAVRTHARMLRDSKFVSRGIQLRKNFKKINFSAGQHRTLFADGPEFVHLTDEVHTLHHRLLIQTASMMAATEAIDELHNARVASVAPFPQVDTSDDESEHEKQMNMNE